MSVKNFDDEVKRKLRNARVRAYENKKRVKFNNNWRAKKCEVCGIENGRITWHHRVPADKEFNINFKHAKKMDDFDILGEVLKCNALCQSCHLKLHKKYKNATFLHPNMLNN